MSGGDTGAQKASDLDRYKQDFGEIPGRAPDAELRARPTPTKLNAFTLSFPRPGEKGYIETIFKYRVEVYACYRDQKIVRDGEKVDKPPRGLFVGLPGDVPTTQRRNVSFEVVTQMAQRVWNVHPKTIIYDRNHILYSTEKLAEVNSPRTTQIERAGNERLMNMDTSFFGRPTHFEVKVEMDEHVKLSLVTNVPATIQFLEIATSMYPYFLYAERMAKKEQKEPVDVFRNTIYFPNQSGPFQRDPRILMKGVTKSVRLVGDSDKNLKYILQIDTKASPFFPPMKLTDFLIKLYKREGAGGPGPGGFDRGRGNDSFRSREDSFRGRGDRGRGHGYQPGFHSSDRERSVLREPEHELQHLLDRNFDNACAQVKNLVVRTVHLGDGKEQIFPIHELTQKSLEELTFTDKEGNKVNVLQYMMDKYRRPVNGRLPAVVHMDKGRKKHSFFPLEFLEIVPGQRVNMQKQQMFPNMSEFMTRECQITPANLIKMVDFARNTYLSMNLFLNHFGIRVDGKMVEPRSAVLLPAPQVLYANSQRAFLNDDLVWKMQQMRFKEPRPVEQLLWCIVDVQRAAGQRTVMEFARKYVGRCRELGLQLAELREEHYYEQNHQNRLDDFAQTFQRLQAKGYSFALFIGREKTDESHTFIKHCEVKFGILTQHVIKRNVDNVRPETLSNIIMKTNLKLGGMNYQVLPNRDVEPLINRTIPLKDTMFVGIAFSAPGPLTLFERQSQQERHDLPPLVPQAAALAYTVDPEWRMCGTYWFYEQQIVRKVECLKEGEDPNAGMETETVYKRNERLKQELQQALQKFTERNFNRRPRHVYIHRNGSCEGDYVFVSKSEVEPIRDLLTPLGITFTFVVVSNKSNNRLLRPNPNPNDRPPKQNVTAGTCMCTEVNHPRFTEFILESHCCIQGTGRPMKYTVLSDTRQPRVSVQELANVSLVASFAHGIVNSPVSMPATLYSAQALSERATKLGKLEGCPDVEQLSQLLRPSLDHRFWA